MSNSMTATATSSEPIRELPRERVNEAIEALLAVLYPEPVEAAAQDAQAVMAATTLPPVVCAPWCVHQDGHGGQRFVEDQRCETAEASVSLSLYPMIDDEVQDESGVWHAAADHLQVYGACSPVAADRVVIGHDVSDGLRYFQVELTPVEAAQLIECLRTVLQQIGARR